MDWQGLLNDDPSRGSLPLSGARYIIRGTLRGTEGQLAVSAFLHDLASTRLIRAQEASGPASSLPDLLCGAVAPELVRGIGIEESGHAALPADDAPWRSQLLISGIGHYYNGNYAEAFPAFLKLLRGDPKDSEAHFWLAQSFHKAGLTELAERQVRQFLADFPEDRNRPRAVLLLGEIEAARQP
jgi:tetratricopeptide (TPR) repeat protein